MDQIDDHAYRILLKAFGDTPYVQHEYWGTHRDFKLDPILSNPEYSEIGRSNQARIGDDGTTIPSVSVTLQAP